LADLHNPAVHGPAGYWLQVQGSFTRALQRQCRRRFYVAVGHEGFGRPAQEEAHRLGLAPRQLAWIREVCLYGDNTPWVLARTIIPQGCLTGRGRRLRNLGNKPLGAFLFSSPEWTRGSLETGLCQASNAWQPRLARRSLFYCGSQALMVGEYLLPALYLADG